MTLKMIVTQGNFIQKNKKKLFKTKLPTTNMHSYMDELQKQFGEQKETRYKSVCKHDAI